MSSRKKGKPSSGKTRPKKAVPGGGASLARLDDWSPGLLKSQAYEQILFDIILGELKPGEQIDEQALARRYGSGVAGIRGALARLALEDLVQRRPRVGTTVSPLDILQIKQAFEARTLIEPHCAVLAALHASAAEIVAIKSAFDGAEAAIAKDDHRRLVTMDEAFHVAVAAASHNRALAKMVVTLHHQAARFWMCAMPDRPSKKQGLQDLTLHRAAARAIEARDTAAAQKAMMAMLGDFPGDVSRTFKRAR